MSLRFQLLGPLRIIAAGRAVPVGPQKQRAMLAALLLSANERVSLDRLVGELWDQPPHSAVANLRTYASGLRRLLSELDAPPGGGDRLTAGVAGYQLRIEPEELDLHRFQAAVERGRTALARGDHAGATAHLREALDLWRGRPAEDVRPGPELDARITLLEEQHLSLVEDLIQARLALGEHASVTGELRLLITAHPYRERLRHQLMLALYRSGDAPAALAAYAETRAVLADQLGLEPGTDLTRLHQAILRRAPELSTPDAAAEPVGPRPAAAPNDPPGPAEPPRQLPPDAAAFVGRVDELQAIERACTATNGSRTGPAVVVLHGPGGMGKTTLAVRAAHRLARHYPDGQLYLELQGGAPGMASVEPLSALGRLLRALGVPARDVPLELAEAAARFRSETAARRLLIVLDGAAGAQQIRPLLPAGRDCAVLITSRRPTGTLDAVRLRLDRLSDAEARQLLDTLCGDGRGAADPAAADRLAMLCDGHPLALRIAGARLAARPDWSVAVLADRLDNERERLDELRADDLAIRSSFWNTYRQLLDSADPDDRTAAAAFRSLSLLRVPEIPAPLAAVTIGVPERRALTLLDRLTETHLLDAVGPTRFRFHDLLRLYGAELAEETDPAAERERAALRGLSAYLTTVLRAGQLLRPQRAAELATGPTVVELATVDDAVRWVDAELAGIIAAARQACDAAPRLSRLCVEAIPSVAGWLQKRNRWAEADALVAVCEQAATRTDDGAARATVLALRATLHWRAGSLEAACGALESALELWRRLGDREGEGRALQNLGWFHHRTGSARRAADLVRAAVRLLATANPVWLAMALHNLAEIEFELGNFPAAGEHLTRCLVMRREHDDAVGEAMTLVALGRTHSQLGRHPDALRALTAGLRLCRRTGNREDEWEALLSRSEVHLRIGDVALAHRDGEEALSLARAVGDRYGEAAALRQLGRVRERRGERAAADGYARQANRIFADLPGRRDGVLETFLARADQSAGVPTSAGR
ncbi:DNA-binding transcriptional activator of the SARP family [Micromonospora echinaurantiaca]|uniref:DNA-binding transcriptional activator of the SARP family n=1 Tax=Micromonospora echinaurantiaca TaxID=47857 RepID=A0A1C5HG17_9ACTN|nr:BTAD domain-containing putative transcriptional regulator [Micromonospora echinaurantiaca]SCG44940.1 DNA-binding transcriptional activator of the SARP family [Micromonospora echinaurantiaca]